MASQPARRVLNVGGNNKMIPLPAQYNDWQCDLLDIDATGNPDIVCDARDLINLSIDKYDAVYCSHNLEHYYQHDAIKVISGFKHVLKSDGFSHIIVPDISELMKIATEKKMDINDVLYQSPAGPITIRDVLYGYGVEIEKSGNDFYAHKNGFSPISLCKMLEECGFTYIFITTGGLEINALASIQKPSDTMIKMFNLPISGYSQVTRAT